MSSELSRREWTAVQAARIVGMTYKRLDEWDRRGFMRPSIRRGSGRGRWRPRLYSFADLIALRVARDLRAQGVSLQALRVVQARLSEQLGPGKIDPLARALLVVTPGRKRLDVCRIVTPDHVESVLQAPGQRVFAILALAGIVSEVRRACEREERAA